MVSRALADMVLVLHFSFIVFVIAGGLLAFRWRWAPLVHIPAALWGIFIEVSGKVCPLTPLENALRRNAGDSGYPGGFIEYYLTSAIYPGGLTHRVQLVLAGFVVLANILVYTVVWWRVRSGSRGAAGIR